MNIDYRQALALIGATVPPHLVADAGVPGLTGPQAQGDLLVFPRPEPGDPDGDDPDGDLAWLPVPAAGVPLVRGEATDNTHWLHRGFASPDVTWAPVGVGLEVARLRVPPGQSALLIHTDEHGANGIGPGHYAIHRKREWESADYSDRLLED